MGTNQRISSVIYWASRLPESKDNTSQVGGVNCKEKEKQVVESGGHPFIYLFVCLFIVEIYFFIFIFYILYLHSK